MGKKKKMKQENGVDSQHSPATVFVSNFPYSFTNSQLEETFSDVGPIRRCFMVTKKGSTEHRGFGFVQFAATEDANRAIELKNGSTVGGRTIGVKHAMHRASLEQRRSKGSQVVPSDNIIEEKDEKDDSLVPSGAVMKTKVDNDDSVFPFDDAIKTKNDKDDSRKPAVTNDLASEKGKTDKPMQRTALLKNVHEEGSSSDKQRVARTVIIGGLLDDNMAEDVHRRARWCGTVSSIAYPLSKEDIEHHGLTQDGCRLGASSILYTSVKSARACVEMLHQKKLSGGLVWARQLGGEGSKTQKWKLIIRNLPFKANVNEIKEMFTAAGFVWDVFIPKNPDSGLAKGFAFVKFTCKLDAENAIQKFNGITFGKRPIAVDWAVPKKVYTTGVQLALEDGQKGSDDEDDSSSDLEDMEKNTQPSDGAAFVPDLIEKEVDFDAEADVARKVLNNFLASSKMSVDSVRDDAVSPQENKDNNKTVNIHKNSSDRSTNTPHVTKPEDLAKSKSMNLKPVEGEEELQRTLFICNLPFDITNEEVKERFKGFGEVQSFVPVLHPVTRRPRGNGFLKFRSIDAADAAFSAANAVAGLGIILKGRQLKVMKALDKKAAHDKEQEKTKKEEHDHRNLYLAKEGLILEGTPAAEGVSESDMLKRQSLEQKKATKLRSPNFHVSRTRLIMYNIPKSMNEKQLKKLCIDAVLSRATKQKPMIRQIKLLKDSNKGKEISKNHSRGVAFIEFTEHQHALVALRVLNNNPETFTPEHRPIVEFALDNIQKLRQHNEKVQAQQQGSHDDAENLEKGVDDRKSNTKSNKRKRKSESIMPEARKDKTVENKVHEEVASEEGKPTKKHKGPSGKENKSSKKKLTGPKEALENQQEGKRPNDSGVTMGKSGPAKARRKGEVNDGPKKKRLRDPKESQNEDASSMKKRKNRKNKDPQGQDTVDKLDMLIEQYRSKFSGNNTNRSDGEKEGSRRLGRWFES